MTQADSSTTDAPAPGPASYPIQFTGSAGEYFRIWIVNLFLTVLTLGIYAAWAKVRTRRYLYAHTELAGNALEYTANPVAILKGNLIVAGGIFAYSVSDVINPLISGIILVLFYLVIPFLVYKSLRFFCYHSVFRNIRMGFRGTPGESYMTYLLLPILIPFTLGLILPYWAFRRKKYLLDNISFGATPNRFSGKGREFYRQYLHSFGVVIIVFLAVLSVAGVVLTILKPPAIAPTPMEPEFMRRAGLLVFSLYLTGFLAFLAVQQFLFARLTNYSWESSVLGTVRFESRISAPQMIWIRASNLLAIACTLGLLIPWAKIRRLRYVLSRMTVVTEAGLDAFVSADQPTAGAVGDAATDFFDFEIGL